MRARSMGLGAVLVVLAARQPMHDARACGVFGGRTVPRLAVEQTLIAFDPAAGREQFVREVRFKDASEAFAFVVPVPSVPEVRSVAASPFEALRASWDFDEVEQTAIRTFLYEPSGPGGPMAGLPLSGSMGFGPGSGRGAKGVAVLSSERVGSFTAAVLQATSAGSLAGWLADNHFASPRSSSAWLERYTRLGFTFVAFRYEKPPAGATGEMRSETVSLSFATPQPYYPYSEPDPADGQATGSRLLRVWLLSPAPYRPVAAHDQPGVRTFDRPWREGMRRDAARSALSDPSLASLLPPGDRLWVQSFLDQKSSRRGWGDAVLVPDQPTTYDEASRARRQTLLRLLIDGAPTQPRGATP